MQNREKLKTPNSEPKDGDTEKLKTKVEEMAKYWKAGFGNNIEEIQAGAENYVAFPEGRTEMRKHTEGLLSAVVGAYKNIPFSKLDNEAGEFKPLFEVNDLLLELRAECEKLWSKPRGAVAKKFFLLGKHIVNLGCLYDIYAQRLLREIKNSAGNENYKVSVEHISGKKIERYIFDDFSEKYLKQLLRAVEESRKELDNYKKSETLSQEQ